MTNKLIFMTTTLRIASIHNFDIFLKIDHLKIIFKSNMKNMIIA